MQLHANPVYQPAMPAPMTSAPAADAYSSLPGASKVAQALLALVIVWDFGLKRIAYGVVESTSSGYKELESGFRDLATVFKVGDIAFRLAAVIAFLVFIHRVFTGMRRELGTTKYSPGAAVGGWFIPFANLVLPALTVGEAWKRKGGSSGFIVYAWWAGYVVFMILSTWSFDRPHARPGEIASLLLSTESLVQLCTYGAWIYIVRELTRRCAAR
jgi:hypothetical protein